MSGGEYPFILPFPGHGERFRPYRLRGEEVEAETARVRGRWQLSAEAKRSIECGPHRSSSAWNSSARRQ